MAATASSALDQITYTDLYRRWENGNWKATEIDFGEDVVQWNETFTELQRRAAFWNYSLFFHGEDAVADNLSPYIDAAPLEEQKYFLTTQQVDEARHSVFFHRFMNEVAGVEGNVAQTLATTAPELTWGFRRVFEHLDKTADDLRRDRSLTQLAKSVTLYHIVVEATLAQPGQHFIESYLTEHDLLPGFRSGMANVALDEQRHIGFGVKLLADLVRQDPECREAIIEMLQEVGSYAVSVFIPPNWDREYTRCFGFELEQIYGEGLISLETKLRTIGLTPDEIQRAVAVPLELSIEERIERSLRMVQANVVGEKQGPASKDPEVVGLFFDSMRRTLDHRHAPSKPAVVQWNFNDTDPWWLRIDNGSSAVGRGLAPDPTLTFTCSWEDWSDVIGERVHPRSLVLRRRLRLRGDLRLLLRMPKMLGR
jgi:ribonucleotide reductase beta subunit family protein with ferritin-like domain